MNTHRLFFAVAVVGFASSAYAGELAKVKVERQPLAAQARRVSDALTLLGEPLTEAERQAIRAAAADADEKDAVDSIQTILDKRCLAGVHITSDKKLETQAGPAKPQLAEQGWRVFLVKVHNEPGLANAELAARSPNALPLTKRSTGKADPMVVSVGTVGKLFLDVMMFNAQPLVRDLSGLELEYRIVQIYCRDSGRKEAMLQFDLNEGKKRIASEQPMRIDFESIPAGLVRLRVIDDDGRSQRDGRPIVAAFTFRDHLGRVYPSPSRRLAPDFNFHFQVYRADGETIALQPGQYTVSYTRGPEYRVLKKTIAVPSSGTHTEEFRLQRWIHLAAQGWYSGDHHIHAAGCAHYESPTEGVTPEDMMRHVLGEDLNVGCCLSWGPCWYHQKRYFEGKVNPLSTSNHLLRYDVEVSGFPSSHCGHICLLRLREQDYPGTKLIGDWPSWDLPIFKWAKAQGAVVGFAHSGWGLQPEKPSDPAAGKLPNYVLPLMDGIGANEYIVDVTQDACDFISTVDTPSVYELNIWYHTLNCGYRTRISGETDFPCIYGERVGLGRSYVHLDSKLDFDAWTEGIKRGRCYVSDGKSHLMDLTVNGLGVGEKNSEIKLAEPGEVEIKAKVAALLEPKPTSETEKIRKTPMHQQPYWDIERARIGDTRTVPVEVVVNGQAIARKEIVADGTEQVVTFRVPIPASSWVALRIFPSSHTNPVFVLVGDEPIRASKRSAEWCLKAVDQCWKQKKRAIRKEEQAAAAKAFEEAREAYKKILAETTRD
ncbi:MAG TPA: CehA/McbA family metallohydrolase [Gemmataceae bacterium]|nr:CehA/McbA family metallohydrolase [Gemmataceae bacterium]